MLSSFINRARKVEPEGIVVVGSGGKIADIALEDGDVIVIPEKTDVVMISGEVIMPQAVVWNEDRDMDDYIKSAGGFSNRADSKNLLVVHPDGEVTPRAKSVQPGDQILVLPRVDSKEHAGRQGSFRNPLSGGRGLQGHSRSVVCTPAERTPSRSARAFKVSRPCTLQQEGQGLETFIHVRGQTSPFGAELRKTFPAGR